MATPAQVERSVSYDEHRPRTSPLDLPSLLLHGRIVYIGMILVAVVMELVVVELMYLQWLDPKASIYNYINSTGTTHDDGETIERWFKTYPGYHDMYLAHAQPTASSHGALFPVADIDYQQILEILARIKTRESLNTVADNLSTGQSFWR